MKKIPTLFVRDPDDRAHVLPEVTPGCEWVLAGEGVATRKYDGTCVLFHRGDDGVAKFYARREVKPGKQPPPNFIPVDHDEVTGKTVGWEPIDQTGWAGVIGEAVEETPGPLVLEATYELIGPKVNRNPEQVPLHELQSHADAALVPWATALPTDPAMAHSFLAAALAECEGMEGIVWHHPDGRMVKIKRRDFPAE